MEADARISRDRSQSYLLLSLGQNLYLSPQVLINSVSQHLDSPIFMLLCTRRTVCAPFSIKFQSFSGSINAWRDYPAQGKLQWRVAIYMLNVSPAFLIRAVQYEICEMVHPI